MSDLGNATTTIITLGLPTQCHKDKGAIWVCWEPQNKTCDGNWHVHMYT
jgi:hypothetical protein